MLKIRGSSQAQIRVPVLRPQPPRARRKAPRKWHKGGAGLTRLKGKISDDGKSITTDKDSKTWTIENPDAVKGHEGHDVKIKGHVDTANNSIHVTSLKMAGEKASKKKSGAMSEQPPK